MSRIKSQRVDTQALLASGFLTAFLAIAFFVLQKVTYETNDDTAMAQIVYGMNTTYYDPHLVYINVLLGYALKFCLVLFPSVPWYTIFQCVTILCAFFVFMYLIFSRFGLVKGVFPVLLLIFFFGKEYCLTLQFSKTAGAAAAAGVLLLLDAAAKQTDTRPYWKWIVGGLLTVIGSLYRFNAFGMVLVPLLGVGLLLIIKPLAQHNWRRLIYICLPFVIVFTVCFGCRLYNTWEYQRTDEWVEFKEFNSLRSELLDYGFPDYIENKDLYQSLNISYTDYEMFSSWDFADPEIFSVEAMKQLVDAKEKPPFEWTNCISNLRHFFFSYRYSVSFLIAIAITMITSKNKQHLLTAYAILSIIALQLYLYLSGRYGLNRIDAVLALTLFLVLVLYCWGPWQYSNKTSAVVLSVLLLLAPFNNFQENPKASEPVPLYELMYSDPNKLYFRTLSTQLPLIPSAYAMYPVGYLQNYCPLGGWTTYSVPYLEKMERFYISNPFRDMVDNPDVFLIASGDIHAKVQYLNNHYYSDVAGRCVKVTEDGYSIYRMTTSPLVDLDTSNSVFANTLPNIHYSLSATNENGLISFNGHLYADNKNSFAANIYIGLTDAAGNEEIYYSTQRYSDAFGDLFHGQYASFTSTERPHDPSRFVKLYLATDDALYCVHMGTLAQILSQSSADLAE